MEKPAPTTEERSIINTPPPVQPPPPPPPAEIELPEPTPTPPTTPNLPQPIETPALTEENSPLPPPTGGSPTQHLEDGHPHQTTIPPHSGL